MQRVAEYLQQQGAHHDVVAWAESFGTDFRRAFTECPRGDWLLAVGVRSGVARKERSLAAAACARLGLEWLDDAAEASQALSALEACARSEQGWSELPALAGKLQARELPDPASATALSAVVLALESASDPEAAALVPSTVVQAAMFAVADCAVMSLLRHTQLQSAEAVRAHIAFEGLVQALGDEAPCAG